MIEKPFLEQFPRPLPRDPDAIFSSWVSAHQEIFDFFDEGIESVAATHSILEASGQDLDRVGDQFGRVGRRRGRGDREYRAFLLSIVPSFEGRGTVSGIKFAVGAGVRAQPDEIYIEEHFDDIEYSVEVGDWIPHRVTTVHELADLADPTGVSLRTPVKYRYGRCGSGSTASNTERVQAITSPPAGDGHGASDTTVTYQTGGFGTGKFDGADPFGEVSGITGSEDGASSGESSYGVSSYGGGEEEEDNN